MSEQLPAITGGFGESPTLAYPDNDAPAGLHYEILQAGDGAVVKAGDKIVVNYHGQIWGGDVFDSSYRRGSTITFPIGVGAVISGWDKTLVGQRIGTRLVISIPPKDGYGSQGMPMAGIGGSDTLVFVTDIVGVE